MEAWCYLRPTVAQWSLQSVPKIPRQMRNTTSLIGTKMVPIKMLLQPETWMASYRAALPDLAMKFTRGSNKYLSLLLRSLSLNLINMKLQTV